MQAGSLDRVITFEALTTSRDGTYSAVQQSWAAYATVAANRMFRSGVKPEQVVDGQVQSMQRVHYRCRWYPGVTASMRINDGGKYYQVLEVAEVGRNEELRIIAVDWNEGRR